MNSSRENHGPTQIRYYVVGILDILNQSSQLSTWPLLENANKNRDELIDALKSTVGNVLFVRELINSALESFETTTLSSAELSSLPAEYREVLARSTQLSFSRQSFSDTVIVYCPLAIIDNHILLKEVSSVLGCLGMAILSCLGHKVAVRGAIDVGLAGDVFENEIYGPVLASVSNLEKQAASYPRIVVGQGLLDLLGALEREGGKSPQAALGRAAAVGVRAMISRDDDGMMICDYLRVSSRSDVVNDGIRDLIASARSFAKSEWDRFRSDGNAKLALRYARLLNYFERSQRHFGPT